MCEYDKYVLSGLKPRETMTLQLRSHFFGVIKEYSLAGRKVFIPGNHIFDMKKTLIAAGTISFIASLLINFKASSVGPLISRTVFLGIFIFIQLMLLVLTIQFFKNKKYFKLIGVLIIFILSYSFYLSIFSTFCTLELKPDYFYQNKFIGECEFGKGSGSCGGMVWYEESCSILPEEKLELLKKDAEETYEQIVSICSSMCPNNTRGLYSPEFCGNNIKYIISGLSCSDVIQCDAIIC